MQKIFRVIKIISEYRILINAGASDVKEGTVLEIFEIGNEIIDPETKEVLGTLDLVKAKIQVEDVFPKMCVCRNYYTKSVPTALGLAVQSMTQLSTKEVMKPLPVNPSDISGGFEDLDTQICVGDKVRASLPQ